MLRLCFLAALMLLNTLKSYGQEKRIEEGLGFSAAANYTFSGIALIGTVEWQTKHHIFYTGPKFQMSRSYLPLEGPLGWNIGYRHEFNKDPEKVISFFFNADYQIGVSKAYIRTESARKLNYVHEAFIGYGVQFRLAPRIYLANVLGVGGHLESYYNTDLQARNTYAGYNNLFKIFLNVKL